MSQREKDHPKSHPLPCLSNLNVRPKYDHQNLITFTDGLKSQSRDSQDIDTEMQK
jgi:hypothetical protein